MIIRISDLPYSIVQQLPLSIRVRKDEYKLDELPPDIQRLIKSVLLNTEQSTVDTNVTYDVDPILQGVTIRPIRTMTELVIYYIRNYLTTAKGTYPWDVNFGSRLRQYVQVKDEPYRRELISKEIYDAVEYVSSILGVNVTVKRISFAIDTFVTDTSVIATIELSVNNQNVTVQI